MALPDEQKDKPNNTPDSGDTIISDVIGNQRVIDIFAGFTRDISTISERLEDSTKNTTVLAPLNSELQKLPRKPWEDSKDYETMGESAYTGSAGEDRAHRNLRRFTEAHVVPVSPWKEGEKMKSVGGGELWWETRDGKKTVSKRRLWPNLDVIADIIKVQPGNIEVSSISNQVSNGEIWILKGVMNYA